MSESGNILNLGDLAKPANALVNRIFDSLHAIATPRQIRRIAKADAFALREKAAADAESAILKAEADLKVEGLQRRALQRFANAEAKAQANREAIAEKAVPLVRADAPSEGISDDWMSHFFEECRHVSSEEMQELWAKVLAGEANKPQSFSIRTLRFLSEMDKRDAESFAALCRFREGHRGGQPLILNYRDSIYQDAGVTYGSLAHLAAIGLIHFEPTTGFVTGGDQARYVLLYDNRAIRVDMGEGVDGGPKRLPYSQRPCGEVQFTALGFELASILEPYAITGFAEYILKWYADPHGFIRHNCIVRSATLLSQGDVQALLDDPDAFFSGATKPDRGDNEGETVERQKAE